MTERLIRSSVAPKLPAIIPWALAGAVFLALQIYAYGAWMLSPDFRPTSHGPDPVPAQVLNIIRGYEIINSVIGVAALIWFVVGIVRTKRINTARLLLLRADASGETAIERGVGRFAGGATRALLRILAFIAFCNVLNLAYTTAMGVHALYGDAWPRDMPSWLANEQ